MTRRSSVAMVAAASLVSSGLALLVFLGAARSLAPSAFVDFAAVWGVVFGLAAVLSAFELEASRQSARGQDVAPLARSAVASGAALACLVVAFAPVAARATHLTDPRLLFWAGLAVAFYPLLLVLRGSLAGEQRLGHYAAITAGENGVRVGFMVAGLVSGSARFVGAVAVGPLVCLLWFGRVWGGLRTGWTIGGLVAQLRRVSPLLSGNVAAALLVTGMPATAIVILGTSDAVGLAVAVALATLSRVPLVLLSSVYGLLVPWFVQREGLRPVADPIRRRLRVALVACGVFVTGGVVTFFAGRLAVDAPERINLWVVAGYTLGAAMLGVLQVATARLVAAGRPRDVQAMWWVAALVAVVVLAIGRVADVDVVVTLASAQGLGPLFALVLRRRSLLRPGIESMPS